MCCLSHAQVSLKGKVISLDNRKPVVSANVYLSNTSVGTITDEAGNFIIHAFPNGRYDLVISFIGYETYHREIRSDQLPNNLEILLVPATKELQEVIVESYDKDGWEKWGAIFMENFIGSSPFAKDCKLKNPEVVHFKLDKKRNTIKVKSDDQLLIDNLALGYHMKYDLTLFEFNLDNKEFLYQGFPLFEEMETKRRNQEKRWMENRQTAYYGSLLHFYRSLFRNRLIEQAFEVKQVVNVSAAEHRRVQKIYSGFLKYIQSKNVAGADSLDKSIPAIDSSLNIMQDSLAYYESVFKQPNNKVVVIDKMLTGDSLAFALDSVTVGMLFSGKLQVVYKPLKSMGIQGRAGPAGFRIAPFNSQVHFLKNEPILVLANGSYFEGDNMMITGYWAWWEKMCNKLPFDYWPPKIK